MKESEKLKIEASKIDDDLAVFGKYKQAFRAEQKEKFDEIWLKKLEVQTKVVLFTIMFTILIMRMETASGKKLD